MSKRDHRGEAARRADPAPTSSVSPQKPPPHQRLINFLNQLPDANVRPWHYLALAVIPGFLTLLNSNWLFENGPHMDPWYYFGFFQNFPWFHNVARAYPGERILWILPGYVFSHIFGQVPGVIVFHVVVFLACLYTFHYICSRLTDGPTAFLATALLGFNAYFVGPNGWDFLESECWLFLMLAIAFAFPRNTRRPWLYLMASGMAWMGLIYSYIAWGALTPAYFWLVLQLSKRKDGYLRTVWFTAPFLAIGAVLTTIFAWSAYAILGGHGFFFAANLASAVSLGVSLKKNIWDDPHWIRSCTWLILPAVAFLMALPLAVPRFRSRAVEPAVPWFHIYSFTILILWTFQPFRIMSVDYRASIMLPGLFLVFALLLFRVPVDTPRWHWLLITIVSAAISIAPLSSRDLAAQRPGTDIVLGGCALLLLLAYWLLLRPASRLIWTLAVFLFSGISFALAPPFTTSAWQYDYNGYELSERVSRAVKLIGSRLPEGAHPVFWVDAYSKMGNELRAIMCSFFAQPYSMWFYPRVTAPPNGNPVPTGSRVFLLTSNRDVLAPAAYQMAREDMSFTVLSQDWFHYGSEGYWITDLRTEQSTVASLRSGLTGYGAAVNDPFHTASPNQPVLRRDITLPQEGIYQFELSGLPTGADYRFGALYDDGKTWLDTNGRPIPENGANTAWFRLASEPNQKIHLALETSLSAADLSRLRLAVLRDGDSTHTVASFNRLVVRPYGNLLQNGGFENGQADWTSSGGEVHPQADCFSGACVEWSGFGPRNYLGQQREIDIVPGRTYEIGAWIRADKTSPQAIEMGVWDKNEERWAGSQRLTPTQTWTHYTLRFTNTNSSQGALRIQNTAQPPLRYEVDEASFLEVRKP